MSQKVQNITNTTYLIDENRTDFEKGRKILGSYPVPLAECARMMCFFLFATYIFLICSVRFLFAAYRFYLQRSLFVAAFLFLFAAFLFCLQRFCHLRHTSFIYSARFLFAAYLFYLQRSLFVCSVSFFVCSVSFLFAGVPCRPSHASSVINRLNRLSSNKKFRFFCS